MLVPASGRLASSTFRGVPQVALTAPSFQTSDTAPSSAHARSVALSSSEAYNRAFRMGMITGRGLPPVQLSCRVVPASLCSDECTFLNDSYRLTNDDDRITALSESCQTPGRLCLLICCRLHLRF